MRMSLELFKESWCRGTLVDCASFGLPDLRQDLLEHPAVAGRELGRALPLPTWLLDLNSPLAGKELARDLSALIASREQMKHQLAAICPFQLTAHEALEL
jgi:hypothetical protein